MYKRQGVARVDCAHERQGHCLRATIAEDKKDSEARLRAMVDFGKTPTRTKLCTRIYLEAALDTLAPNQWVTLFGLCLLYTSPSPRHRTRSRMPSSA